MLCDQTQEVVGKTLVIGTLSCRGGCWVIEFSKGDGGFWYEAL